MNLPDKAEGRGARPWHDCYREITPPDDVILNILICSRGNLAEMIHAAKLAIVDCRDLQLGADQVRNEADHQRG